MEIKLSVISFGFFFCGALSSSTMWPDARSNLIDTPSITIVAGWFTEPPRRGGGEWRGEERRMGEKRRGVGERRGRGEEDRSEEGRRGER